MAQTHIIYMNIISLFTHIMYSFHPASALGDATEGTRRVGDNTLGVATSTTGVTVATTLQSTPQLSSSISETRSQPASLPPDTSPMSISTSSVEAMSPEPLYDYHDEVPLLKRFPWDKEKQSPTDYQQNFCSMRCNGSEIVGNQTNGFFCRMFQCLDCDCNRPSCEIYDNCCPDISEPHFEIKATLQSLYDPSSLLFGQADSVSAPKSSIDKFNNLLRDSKNDSKEVGGVNYTSEVSSTDVENFDMSVTPVVDLQYQKKTVKILCDDTTFPKGLLYIRSCPSDYTDQNTTRMCELVEPSDVMSYTRISDKATNVVYYNEYCARCNGVTQFVPWIINIECHHFMHVYKATNTDEFLRLSLQNGSECYVKQYAPSDAVTTSCDPYYFSEDIIDKCNTSTTWTKIDEDVKRACEGNEFSLRKYRVIDLADQKKVYNNVFCAICNERIESRGCSSADTWPEPEVEFSFQLDPRQTSPIVRNRYKSPYAQAYSDVNVPSQNKPNCNKNINPSKPDPSDHPALSFLLGVKRSPPDLKKTYTSPFKFNPTCSNLEWPSPNNDCLPFQCSPGKVLVGIECTTRLNFIQGLGYKLRLIAEINTTVHITLSSNTDILTRLEKMLDREIGYLGFYDFEVGMTVERSQRHVPTAMSSVSSESFLLPGNNHTGVTEHRFIILYFWIKGYIMAWKEIMRDVLEQVLLSRIFDSVFEFEIMEGTSLMLRPSVMINDFENCNSLKAINNNIECLHKRVINSELRSYNPYMFTVPDLYLNVSHILNCSFIRFNSTQYEFVTNISRYLTTRNISIILNLSLTNVSFSYISDFNMLEIDNDGTLKVCHQLLDKKLLAIEKFREKTNLSSQLENLNLAKYILTLICLSVSMLCLALTLLTYFLFKVLRNMAGIHNMFLCTSLLLAQGSLLAASHLKVPSVLCTALGISTHFLWLCNFCWSFLCCYHMFKVFTSKTRNSYSTPSSQMKQLVKNVALTTLVPALIVTFVIIVSYLTSETSEIGYGHIVCYLDSTILLGVTMIAPLVLVTLTNIIFFIITVVKIHNVRKLQTHFKKEDRQNLYVYIKLSTVTGALWLVSIIGESLQVDALNFMAILLNGLQGVFIFISYICNKRVLNLYIQSVKTVTLSSESHPKTDQSTLNTITSGVHSMPADGERKVALQIHSGWDVSNMDVGLEVHQMPPDVDVSDGHLRMLKEISSEDQTLTKSDERKFIVQREDLKTQ